MILEINAGLDKPNGPNKPFQRRLRAAAVESFVKQDTYGDVALIGDLNGADEPCVWARFDRSVNEGVLDLFELAEELGQDCIAVRFPDGSGVLVGPNAQAWGDFNPDFFRRPANVEEL